MKETSKVIRLTEKDIEEREAEANALEVRLAEEEDLKEEAKQEELREEWGIAKQKGTSERVRLAEEEEDATLSTCFMILFNLDEREGYWKNRKTLELSVF